MGFVRVVLGLPMAGAYLALIGPPRRWAQSRGLDWGRGTPVAFHRLLCRLLRVDVRRLGAPSADGPRLIVSNHVSWLDILVLGAIEPMTFLAKKEIGGPWLGRQLAGLQGVVYVDRQRKRAIPKTNADMAAAMRAGEPVVLFAEATTSDGMRLLKFKSSHFEAARVVGEHAVVQPVYMHFHRLGGLAVTRRDLPKIAWYGEMTFLPHLFGVIRAGGVSCDVIYGEPIRAADHPNRKALTRATEVAVKRLAERAKRGAMQ
jgi:1-acyl-sn-glycerol-3-phosphate acyltransferase